MALPDFQYALTATGLAIRQTPHFRIAIKESKVIRLVHRRGKKTLKID
jgi:hypothetical protein